MSVVLYSKNEVEKIKEASVIIKEVFKQLKGYIKPGISTKDVDKLVEDIIYSMSAIPSSKGYCGFPASCCTSVNNVVVHGIPSSKTILKEGDIISVDVVANKNGFHSDACRTFPVGNISKEAERLIQVTKEAFFKGLECAKVGKRVGDISHAIQKHVEAAGFGVVREYQGHGVGRSMHEEPPIPNYGRQNRGFRLKSGTVLAIEPMVTYGDYSIRVLADKWTAVTTDNSIAAHYENTVVVTNNEPLILTIEDEA